MIGPEGSAHGRRTKLVCTIGPATATAERIPGAWVVLEADAGHFPWVERPGCVVAAVDRLAGEVGTT